MSDEGVGMVCAMIFGVALVFAVSKGCANRTQHVERMKQIEMGQVSK